MFRHELSLCVSAIPGILLVKFLMDEGLLPGERKCPVSNCGHPMRLHQSSAYPDGCYWYYGHVNKKNKKRCKKNLSVRTGTWFFQSRLSLVKIVSLITLHGKLYLLIGFFFADLDCIYFFFVVRHSI